MPENSEKENHPPRILLIDDDEEFTDDLIFLLGEDYQFKTAGGSKQALEILENENFDLIILDLAMPAYLGNKNESEGIELFKVIQEKCKNRLGGKLVVFILTGIDPHGVQKVCLEMGADAFIRKPPSIYTLKKRIDKILMQNKNEI